MNHLEILENSKNIPLYPAMSLIIKRHNSFFDEKLKGTGVSAAELPYLVRIYNDNNNITQRDLCNLFFVSEPVVARTLKNLENKGFVIRNNDPQKKTRKLLSLTDKGVEINKRMFNINAEWEKHLFDNLSVDEIENYKMLTKLLAINSMKL